LTRLELVSSSIDALPSMALRKKLKILKGKFERKILQTFASWTQNRDGPVRSANSTHNVAPPSRNLTLEPLVTPTLSSPSPLRSVSTLPEEGQTVINGTWISLKAFLRILDQSAGVFGPLKRVMDELVLCINMYEVGLFTCLTYCPNLIARTL
jgi:hypothetical protein